MHIGFDHEPGSSIAIVQNPSIITACISILYIKLLHMTYIFHIYMAMQSMHDTNINAIIS